MSKTRRDFLKQAGAEAGSQQVGAVWETLAGSRRLTEV